MSNDLVPYGRSRKLVKYKRGMDASLALELAADRNKAIRAVQQVHDVERVADYGLRAAGHLGRAAEAEAGSCQTAAMQQAILSVGVRAIYEIGGAVEDLRDGWR